MTIGAIMGITSAYDRFAKKADEAQSLLLLLIRLYIGYQSAVSGWGQWTHFDKTAAYFASLHIPLPKISVAISASTELVGGILLLLGLCSRPVALVMAFNFLVAILSVELSNYGFSWRRLDAAIWNHQTPICRTQPSPFSPPRS
jgi:uncharacterized membrane protein YphA (DoxX/SURF4 family)